MTTSRRGLAESGQISRDEDALRLMADGVRLPVPLVMLHVMKHLLESGRRMSAAGVAAIVDG